MIIALHIGLHLTDQGKLVRSIGRNRAALKELGTAVPKPWKYRKRLAHAQTQVRSYTYSPLTKRYLFGEQEVEFSPERLVLSSASFSGTPRQAFSNNVFYENLTENLAEFCEIFPDDTLEVFLAIRNPATFLPALFTNRKARDFALFMDDSSLWNLRWSELIERTRIQFPEVPLTIWCNEDSPLIWEQLIRELSGVDPTFPLSGCHDLLEELMTAEGIARFKKYLSVHPEATELQKRRVIAAFLAKFAKDDKMYENTEIPDLDEHILEEITDAYEADTQVIQRMHGVNFIAP